MHEWNSSPHPISDVREWLKAKRLELRPAYQRQAVWSLPAKVMLMDSIIRGIPMPKIFLAATIKGEDTYRVVIDGQQRLTAIFGFLRDEFSLVPPYEGEGAGKKFSELDESIRKRILRYKLDFNEAIDPTDDESREVFSRVNKYTVPLTKQELRRAYLPGDFLDLSEELAVDETLDRFGVFTPAARRRYSDVEYVSELLSAMLEGIQDKKSKLDEFYINYSCWDKQEKEAAASAFHGVIEEIHLLFSDMPRTRFFQKADFYTLFLVIHELKKQGLTVQEKPLQSLREDLLMLDFHIRPESQAPICMEYAVKCVSQANSASSRRWRHNFMRAVLAGTYLGGLHDAQTAGVFYRLAEDVFSADDGYCPSLSCGECPVCSEELSDSPAEYVLVWPGGETVKQIYNSSWAHQICVAGNRDWSILERPLDGQCNLL